ncbi:hypothetical protein OAC78_08395 [Litorivicinus sp.]|jgi:hypothetical protein|nr:hypothetical protein [Litorivicinus sp.]MDC1319757.1 hypothetical protein [Litorivicinus sp.]|tara:strand:- start:281 stop:493 length:213 start_codon:yes stop_codon:yes gene_type:complete
MSVLAKSELENDLNCLDISLISQCRALICEGELGAVDDLLEKNKRNYSDKEFLMIKALKEVAASTHRIIG